MADTVEGLVKAEQWLMRSRLPGHEASAINAASAIQVAREAIAALKACALAAEAQRDKLRSLVEQSFRDGLIYASNVVVTDPDEAWRTSRALADLDEIAP